MSELDKKVEEAQAERDHWDVGTCDASGNGSGKALLKFYKSAARSLETQIKYTELSLESNPDTEYPIYLLNQQKCKLLDCTKKQKELEDAQKSNGNYR